MENIYYVYAILDNRKPGIFKYENLTFDFEPIYIGKGKQNRMYEHTKEAKTSLKNVYKLNKIRSIIKETNYDPVCVKIFENLFEEEAYSLEISTILKIGRYPFGPLTNENDGGYGQRNPNPTTRKKLSKGASLPHSPERKERRKNNSMKLSIHKNFGSQSFENNGNAGPCVLLVSPQKIYFCKPGTFTSTCKQLGICRTMMKHSYNHFNKTNEIRKVNRVNKFLPGDGWYAIKFSTEISDQIKNITMEDQQLSLLLNYMIKGKFNDYLVREYIQVDGKGENPLVLED